MKNIRETKGARELNGLCRKVGTGEHRPTKKQRTRDTKRTKNRLSCNIGSKRE
jgi:hypothetical protein